MLLSPSTRATTWLLSLLAVPSMALTAQENGASIVATRIDGTIVIDGELSDAAWQTAPIVDGWLETNPGDNLPDSVGTRGRIAYDDRFLYAAFELDDPEPTKIVGPMGDHDHIGNPADFAGVFLDARNDGKTAQMFLVNAGGVLYDAISSDATGEDSSPDFFWDAATKRTPKGWQLELRIPFSSIRYTDPNPQQWGILMYRNRPREFRYQYFSSRLPRDRDCFICNVRPLTGLANLPTGSHYVAAPYVSGAYTELPEGDLGSPLEGDDGDLNAGLDVKWIPNPETVIDATLHPDFTQIESDTAQITANERFALFFPELRPFFLESVDLFKMPMDAVYTRTFTDPRWGARATGGGGATKYTLLVGEDEGGGSLIIPGSNSSDFANQDFDSKVVIGRVRHDFGESFGSFLYSGREIGGGGYNRLFGPDFRWRPTQKITVVGQLLWSFTETPDRPDLAAEWDGRSLDGHAAKIAFSRGDGKWDSYIDWTDVGDEFRAYNGFIPQVGYRAGYAEGGYTFRPASGAVRRLRLFAFGRYAEDRSGTVLERSVVPGFGLDALWNSFVRVEFAFEELRAIDHLFERRQIRPTIEIRPGGILANVSFSGSFGDQIDFSNDRLGEGGSIGASAELVPTDHLRVSGSYNRRWLDIDTAGGPSGRLFTAQVARLRAVYTFTAESWLRLVTQWVESERDPALWTFDVDRRSGDFAASLVFAYKLNWQTVFYLGAGDARSFDDADELQPAERQAFLKIAYAFQR